MKIIPFIKLFIILFPLSTALGQEWANVKRYEKENALLSVVASKVNGRVVFIGNSITEGWIKTRPAFFEGKPYVNRGISGQTTSQMLGRFRQDVINLKPAVAVLLAGINDIAENTGPITLEAVAGNVFSMAELAKANKIKVIMCSVLPASDFKWKPGMQPGPKVVKLNMLLKKYANDNAIPYLDYYTPMVNDSQGLKSEYGEDGVHPNDAGYAVMEPLIEKAIQEISKKQ
jgi:lysophospholipase L1-like esterase